MSTERGPRVLAARAPHRVLPGHHFVQPPGDTSNLLLLAHHYLGGGGLRRLRRPAGPRPPPPRSAVQTSAWRPRAIQLKKKKKESPPPGPQLPDDCAARGLRAPGKGSSVASSAGTRPHVPTECQGEGGTRGAGRTTLLRSGLYLNPSEPLALAAHPPSLIHSGRLH